MNIPTPEEWAEIYPPVYRSVITTHYTIALTGFQSVLVKALNEIAKKAGVQFIHTSRFVRQLNHTVFDPYLTCITKTDTEGSNRIIEILGTNGWKGGTIYKSPKIKPPQGLFDDFIQITGALIRKGTTEYALTYTVKCTACGKEHTYELEGENIPYGQTLRRLLRCPTTGNMFSGLITLPEAPKTSNDYIWNFGLTNTAPYYGYLIPMKELANKLGISESPEYPESTGKFMVTNNDEFSLRLSENTSLPSVQLSTAISTSILEKYGLFTWKKTTAEKAMTYYNLLIKKSREMDIDYKAIRDRIFSRIKVIG